MASREMASRDDFLWEDFEKCLFDEESQFSDFSSETNWRDVLGELGFSALKSGKLMKLIMAKQADYNVRLRRTSKKKGNKPPSGSLAMPKQKQSKKKEPKRHRTRNLPKNGKLAVIFSTNEKFGFNYTGSRVEKVVPGSQADNANVPEGWYICSINGQPQTSSTIKQAIWRAKVNRNRKAVIEFSKYENQANPNVVRRSKSAPALDLIVPYGMSKRGPPRLKASQRQKSIDHTFGRRQFNPPNSSTWQKQKPKVKFVTVHYKFGPKYRGVTSRVRIDPGDSVGDLFQKTKTIMRKKNLFDNMAMLDLTELGFSIGGATGFVNENCLVETITQDNNELWLKRRRQKKVSGSSNFKPRRPYDNRHPSSINLDNCTQIYTVGEDGPYVCGYDKPYHFKILSNDEWILPTLRKGFLFEKYCMIAIWPYVSNGGTVVDVGANIGTHAIPLAHAVGPTGRVIAFEPQSIISKILKENLKLNGARDRVDVVEACVGHTKKMVTLGDRYYDYNIKRSIKVNYTSTKLNNSGAVGIGIGGEEVKMITLDSLDLKNVCVLKVDVEGAEPLVFYGGQNTIRQNLPVIMFERNEQTLQEDILDRFRIPNAIAKFDLIYFCESLGYNQLVELPRDNYLLLHPNRQQLIQDEKWNVEPISKSRDPFFNEYQIAKFTFLKPTWSSQTASMQRTSTPYKNGRQQNQLQQSNQLPQTLQTYQAPQAHSIQHSIQQLSIADISRRDQLVSRGLVSRGLVSSRSLNSRQGSPQNSLHGSSRRLPSRRGLVSSRALTSARGLVSSRGIVTQNITQIPPQNFQPQLPQLPQLPQTRSQIPPQRYQRPQSSPRLQMSQQPQRPQTSPRLQMSQQPQQYSSQIHQQPQSHQLHQAHQLHQSRQLQQPQQPPQGRQTHVPQQLAPREPRPPTQPHQSHHPHQSHQLQILHKRQQRQPLPQPRPPLQPQRLDQMKKRQPPPPRQLNDGDRHTGTRNFAPEKRNMIPNEQRRNQLYPPSRGGTEARGVTPESRQSAGKIGGSRIFQQAFGISTGIA